MKEKGKKKQIKTDKKSIKKEELSKKLKKSKVIKEIKKGKPNLGRNQEGDIGGGSSEVVSG